MRFCLVLSGTCVTPAEAGRREDGLAAAVLARAQLELREEAAAPLRVERAEGSDQEGQLL